MNDIMNTSAASNKKVNLDTFSVTAFGTSYLFVRTGKDRHGNDRWFNIAKCEINRSEHIDENDGLVPNAIPVHPEEVAYLVAEAERRDRELEYVESLLEQWINLRRFRSRRAKRRLSLHKKEMAK